MSKQASAIPESPEAKKKIITGTIVFIIGQLSPLIFIPIVISLDLPSGWTTAISGLLMFGIPELAILAAVAIMGKEGFNFIKQKIFGFFKKMAPPGTVSRTRYRIGLVMFVIPFFIAWLMPYFEDLFPVLERFGLYFNIGGDLLLVASLFVLGGDFWDKIGALFVQDAKVK